MKVSWSLVPENRTKSSEQSWNPPVLLAEITWPSSWKPPLVICSSRLVGNRANSCGRSGLRGYLRRSLYIQIAFDSLDSAAAHANDAGDLENAMAGCELVLDLLLELE